MLSEEQTTRLRPQIISLQSIAGAMIVASTLAASVIAMIANWDEIGDPLSMLPLIGAVFGLLMIGSGIVFPLVFAGEFATGESEEKQIKSAVHSVSVEYLVRFSLVEAALFTNLLVLMLDLHTVTLGIVGFAMVTFLFLFPFQSKFVSSVEKRIQ
ncbi:hypothetical protein N9093_01560 [bacterium]|nr:hypothetical protein [bacterium]MDA7880528.1 hypothetical protein [Mariniblastus sp.]MDA7885205.1 hypothetical protein [bacterium]MDA7910379.1 hypothetical protein [bacterium]MDA7913315.1 hypothetical protein [bacterium]